MTDALLTDSNSDLAPPPTIPDAARAGAEPDPTRSPADGSEETRVAGGASVADTGLVPDRSAPAGGDTHGAAGAASALLEDRRDGPGVEDAGAGGDAGGETAVLDGVSDGADGAAAAAAGAATVSPVALVDMLVETAAPRRNKRVRRDEARSKSVPMPESLPIAAPDEDGVVKDGACAPEHVAALPVLDDADSDAWRAAWPDNAVHIVGRLLPRASEAPALDGVHRTRMELALVEQLGDAFGTLGNVPLFVLPGAPGFTSIANEIQRARKQKRRLESIMVEIHGVLRQMPDRDLRYASERYAVLMGVEVHQIQRVARDAEQFAYWRGRAQVIASRRYEHKGIPYQRVTAVVALKQRKPRLRGTSVTHIPVDFLVAPEHEHADRFRHIGQHLLIEATIGAAVYHLHADHPALAGIEDPRRKAHLQVLRESVVTVTLGEFPDEAAERDYRTWVTAGRPRPPRQGRAARSGPSPGPPPAARSDRPRAQANGDGRMQPGNAETSARNGRPPHVPHGGSGNRSGEHGQGELDGVGRKTTRS